MLKVKELIIGLIAGIHLLSSYPSYGYSTEQDILDSLKSGEKSSLKVQIVERRDPLHSPAIHKFCLEFAKELVKSLNGKFRSSEDSNRQDDQGEILLEIEGIERIESPRFKSVSNGSVDLKCGPDTRQDAYYLKPDLDSIIFSNPFIKTGTKLLVKNTVNTKILQHGSSETEEKIIIGAIRGTTNSKDLEDYQKTKEKVQIEVCDDSTTCIQHLRDGNIDAFASDDILLQELQERDNTLKDHYLYPSKGYLARVEPYAMVIRRNNYKLREYIDEIIETKPEMLKDLESKFYSKNIIDTIIDNISIPINVTGLILYILITLGSLSLLLIFIRYLMNSNKNNKNKNSAQTIESAQAVREIQEILDNIEKSYPIETFTQKAVVVEKTITTIEANPDLKQKIINTLKAMSIETFVQLINNPVANILRAGIEEWLKPEKQHPDEPQQPPKQ